MGVADMKKEAASTVGRETIGGENVRMKKKRKMDENIEQHEKVK